jgi:hypothetical protein
LARLRLLEKTSVEQDEFINWKAES